MAYVTPVPVYWSLVEAHWRELRAYARRLTGDAADDVVQEALLRALRSYPRVTDGSHLRAWLYRIVTTTAFDHRAASARNGTPTPDVPDAAAEDPLYDGAFETLVASLPDGVRAALTLRFVDDLAYADIAARLACSEAAARQRVASGIRSLRRRLA